MYPRMLHHMVVSSHQPHADLHCPWKPNATLQARLEAAAERSEA
jgi:hypothetical protein